VPTSVSAGDIYASFPGDVHEIRSDAVFPLKFDFIAINTTVPELSDAFMSLATDFHSPEKRVIRDERISDIVSRATAEEGRETPHSDRMLALLLEEVFIYTLRAFRALKAPKRISDPADAELFCYDLMSYIDSHIYTMKSLTELSEYTNYNYNYLSNLFKSVTDETLLGYYRRKRFELARQLLEDRTNTVTRVAALLNYSSVYTFSRAYKEYFGVAPTQISK
jgi:AraC-like DNA-binding protein